MKQIIQSYRNGKIEIDNVPCPTCPKNAMLVQTFYSVVSIGTERSMIELGRKSLVGKARSRPDLVKRFIEKARNEGLIRTFNSAMRRLNDAMPLGYSSAGKVVEVGSEVRKFAPGDMVSCIGGGFASHAEFVVIPENLARRVPSGVTNEEAAFGMLGIIAMHAVRCANLEPGSQVAVVGLGLLGLLQVQILDAYGYQVIATDLDERKRDLCRALGVQHCLPPGEAFIDACDKLSEGFGVDAVILGVATKSDQPIHDAVRISRPGGRIVLMGVADVHPHRNDLWEKEVSIAVSKAGGPGIGDENYERKGRDYPPEYVRWTEGRNLGEFLRLLSDKKIKIDPLITHRQPFENALELYERLLSDKAGLSIGVILQYPETGSLAPNLPLGTTAEKLREEGKLNLGIIGGGLFAKTTMLPSLAKVNDFALHTICTSRGLTGGHVGKTHRFYNCTTDFHSVVEDKGIDALLILTQHKDHAWMVEQGVQSGKHTFVEKPLCVNHEELERIQSLYCKAEPRPVLFVGYNRRFSALGREIRQFMEPRAHPLIMQYRVNAGFVPRDHWLHDSENGNGRIIGEACHMVDFLMFLTGSMPRRVSAERASSESKDFLPNDNAIITIKFEDGSVGSITYAADGDRALPRERIEAYCDGKTAVLDDFRSLTLYAKGRKKHRRLRNQDLGYVEELNHFADVLKGRCEPGLTPEQIFFSTRTVLSVQDALQTGKYQEIGL